VAHDDSLPTTLEIACATTCTPLFAVQSLKAAQQAEEKTETQAAYKLAAERGDRYKENSGDK
jgi:hypothetical protein